MATILRDIFINLVHELLHAAMRLGSIYVLYARIQIMAGGRKQEKVGGWSMELLFPIIGIRTLDGS
jgi:hypothetical protein